VSIKLEIINADKVLKGLLSDLIDLKKNKISVVTRQALNRTLRDTNVQAKRNVRDKLNLKLRIINKKKLVVPMLAKGKRMEASLKFSGDSISLINFINNPSPMRQGYIPVKKRKPLSIKVGKSRTTLKTAFIQRGKKNRSGEGNLHVFKRIGVKTYW
jgi:hypothetical protein